MICVLIGYPGSQKIIRASKYLAKKYFGFAFNRIYLNYKGDVSGWSSYLREFLECIDDDYIVFALDDYLIAGGFEDDIGRRFWTLISTPSAVCIKLCESTAQEHEEYPVTTQYTIWNRRELIWLLSLVRTPWEFEIVGSRLLNAAGKKSLLGTCMSYYANSSISSRWQGVKLDGLKQEDVDYIKQNHLIDE